MLKDLIGRISPHFIPINMTKDVVSYENNLKVFFDKKIYKIKGDQFNIETENLEEAFYTVVGYLFLKKIREEGCSEQFEDFRYNLEEEIYKDFEDEVTSLEEKIASLEEEIADSQDEIDRISSLEEEIEYLEGKIADLKKE